MNNSCAATSYPGLVRTDSPITVWNDLIQQNTFDNFLGGSSTITFIRCIFDKSLTWTESVSFSTTECSVASNVSRHSECPVKCTRTLSGLTHEVLSRSAGSVVELTVAAHPMLFVVPKVIGFTVSVDGAGTSHESLSVF
jgi:hypothetical protein